MPICNNCGESLSVGAKFCASCGTLQSASPSSAESTNPPAPPPVSRVIVAKSGWRLALKGFLLAFIPVVIISAATKNEKTFTSLVTVISFLIGAGYIVSSLNKWKKNNDVVHGTGIGWTVAVLLVIAFFGGLANLAGSGGSAGSSVSPDPSSVVVPKEVLLRDVKLDYNWSKSGFGNVMIADFTIKNPTPYRFKDFEVKCTHFAPSGTVIDSNTRTIYEIVEPQSTKRIKQMNMGFIHSQAAKSGCEIRDLTVL
jgi:hypothetical protein